MNETRDTPAADPARKQLALGWVIMAITVAALLGVVLYCWWLKRWPSNWRSLSQILFAKVVLPFVVAMALGIFVRGRIGALVGASVVILGVGLCGYRDWKEQREFEAVRFLVYQQQERGE